MVTRKPKPKAKKTDEQCKLYLRYIETRSGGEAISDEPYSSRKATIIYTNILGIFKNEVSSYYGSYSAEFSVPKSYCRFIFLWAVGIRYSDGDSFGTTCGHIKWIGLTKTEKEAAKLLSDAKASEGYKPWEGWACSFEADELHYLPIAK